ncbi:ATP-binding protein, partial [Persicitalea sp.]|uniref:ATP-binding protein n=1 Tax=Persicitalea sp. TaxID=3100273 RepID=UPI003592ED1A
ILETLRSIGYTLEVAIADIVDNSISAGSTKIDIHFEWEGPDSWITIADNGSGMSETGIVNAMRPGSHNPLAEREPHDLGRFGLGLKTASFSQCRRLTVISRLPGEVPAHWCWSHDHVAATNRWELIQQLDQPQLFEECQKLPGGTIVLWEDMDRLTKGTDKDNAKHLANFLKAAASVKQHLSMFFHRFLTPDRLKIDFNGNPVEPWDPYMHGQPGLQPQAEESMAGGQVLVKGYVLPHISLLTSANHEKGGGPGGWNAQQGFYIYRNERLLVAGSWLGMFKKEEHYKLARIRLDITNQQDTDWQIDIKKSVARPPDALRDELRRIADSVRRLAVEVYRHRGKVLQRSLTQTYVPVWQEKVRRGRHFYGINREHPVVRQALAGPNTTGLIALMRILEETVPIPLIVLNESREPNAQPVSFDTTEVDLLSVMKLVYNGLLMTMNETEARRQILMIEPFNDHPYLLESL